MADRPVPDRWVRILGRVALLGSVIGVASPADVPAQGAPVPVVVETTAGTITIDVDTIHSPLTGKNFLRYVDGRFYDGGRFFRTVRADNDPSNPVHIEVVQAAADSSRQREQFPPIALERTTLTRLHHRGGTVSMARNVPNSAVSSFFICIDDEPSLDFGGARNRDGQGFAAFGQVVSGMDVVRAIWKAHADGQALTPPIIITRVHRRSRA